MLKLILNNTILPEPDTDFEFLADSEVPPASGLRTVLTGTLERDHSAQVPTAKRP